MTVALDPGVRLALSAEVRSRVGQMPHGHRLDSGQCRLRGRARRAQDARQPRTPRRLRQSENTPDRPEPSVQRELAYGGMLGEALARDLPGGGEDRQSDREVEPGALLPQARGSEIDRDSPQRPFELRRGDSAPHALLRLRARAVGKTDDREGGNAALQVGLDLDATGVETDERMRDGAREHPTHARLPRRT